ncbi:MAG TPA: YncE family protein, partial [Gemmatimonadaceae bacterium]
MLRPDPLLAAATLCASVLACNQPTAPTRPDVGGLASRIQGDSALNGTLYVTDRLANMVWAIDVADGRILASSPTQVRPIGVEMAAGKVYTANESSGTVSVFDAVTLSPRKVIALPGCSRPHHTHTSTDQSRVYVACFGSNRVAVIDTRSDELEALWTSGTSTAVTHQPWATTNGQSVWVANTQSHDVTELDARTGEILRTLPTRPNPIEIVIHASSRLGYVSIPGSGLVQIFDLAAGALAHELMVSAPENLMIGDDGRRILSSTGGRRSPTTTASIIDTRSFTVTTVELPGTLATHNDLTGNGKYGFVSLE